ncbi:hypothetical protein LOTGIDRAFT_159956 [Lottia gigantea]|uniref:Fucolectin tachylectin-4 pentraxin-1 domain-containing protein n=1 Tax=Lottia gigantea TaxID=225164 RepID=V4AS47_LOTGI|nr:hypothetical protein LOTGIDRAFT_159956 [Lottia gigantea]ESO96541.1 hypothetical protein LOTGIDRAFT_159956 [Lottia gigantea]
MSSKLLNEGERRNLVLSKPAIQSSQYLGFVAGRANDGIDGGFTYQGSCSHTAGHSAPAPETHPWWEVDLLQEYYISAVAISHIYQGSPQLCHDFSIKIYRDGETIDDAVLCYYHVGQPTKGATGLYWCKTAIKGRHVKVIDSEYLTTTSFTKFDDGDLEFPNMTYSVQGYGQCAMKCYVLPMCHIFSVKLVSDYYQCNIFTTENPKLIANTTGNPATTVFMI